MGVFKFSLKNKGERAEVKNWRKPYIFIIDIKLASTELRLAYHDSINLKQNLIIDFFCSVFIFFGFVFFFVL